MCIDKTNLTSLLLKSFVSFSCIKPKNAQAIFYKKNSDVLQWHAKSNISVNSFFVNNMYLFQSYIKSKFSSKVLLVSKLCSANCHIVISDTGR